MPKQVFYIVSSDDHITGWYFHIESWDPDSLIAGGPYATEWQARGQLEYMWR